MKKQEKDIMGTGQGSGGILSSRGCHLRSERGVVLLIVIVLSAVALAVMTALIYLITTGTQVSGLQKKYKTAIEAGKGGGNIFFQLIALRADDASTNAFKANLDSFGIYSTLTTTTNCHGLLSSATYTGLAAKLLTPSTSWVNCDSAIAIDPNAPTTYDMKMELGTTTKFNVYAKIVATTPGNTGGGSENLISRGVVNANTGEVAVMAKPYIYAIETLSENTAQKDGRAKISILYQY